MIANKASALVPLLRFPEFRDAPEWEVGRCSDIAKVLTGYGFPEKFQGSKKGKYPFYKVSDISRAIEKGEYISEAKNYIDSDVLKKIHGKSVPIGTIIFAKIGEAIRLNRRVITTKPAVIDNNTAGVKAIKEKSSDEFLFYLWSNVSLIDHAGGVVPAVSKSSLENVPLCYPSDPSEQQKIADCLGSLDDLIAVEGRKLEALHQYKIGLMQQLFPQPGETVPRLRFPEFSKDGAWKETTIGNMGEVITGSTPSTSRRDFYGGNFMFVSPADISDLRYVYETKTTLTEAGFAECRPIEKNSVLFVCIGSIGKVAQCSRRCATNQQINSLVSSPAFFSDFCYYLLDRESKRIAELAGIQVLPIINKSLFASVKVTTPAFAEQQRIANCLSSLDAQLASQQLKITALKAHKWGLMQQLFPSLDGR